jgi:hypothetical protein
MTCVVAWLEEKSGKVHMGVDSAGSGWNCIHTRKDPKLFRVKTKAGRGAPGEELLIGVSGSFRLMQLLQFHLKLPGRKRDQDPYEYIVREFIPAVRETTASGGFRKDKAGQESMDETCFLVAIGGRVFQVWSDFQVDEREEPFNATGSGSFYALGAMHVLSEQELLPEQRLQRALDAASHYTPTVRGPFTFDTL